MIRREKIALIFWLLLSLFVSFESWRMGLGSLRVPGPGFLSFGVSLIIVLLVLLLFWRENRGKIADQATPLFKGKRVRNILLGFLFLFGYPILLDKLGFFLCNLLFIGLCLKTIGGKKWVVVIGTSVAVAMAAHFLFDVWLMIQVPKGKWVTRLLSLGGF